MKIKIPSRHNAPATSLYVEVLTASNSQLGDRRVMLLLPGGPGGNHSVYETIKSDLLRYADLIMFDPRGCGYSDESDAKFCSIDHFIEDIEALKNHFNLHNMILLGGSYGAMAAIGYAIKYSKDLDKLILIAGAPSYRFLETAKTNLEQRGSSEQIEAAKDLFAGTFKNPEHFREYYKITSSLYLFKPVQQNEPPTVKPNIPYNINITNYGYGDFLRKFDFESDLKNINCKTLILVGKEDWINDPIHSKYTAENIPNAKLVVLNDCGHFIWVDQREKFLQALDEFLLKPKNIHQIKMSL